MPTLKFEGKFSKIAQVVGLIELQEYIQKDY